MNYPVLISKITIVTALLLVSMTRLFAGADPLAPYLDGKPPEILREVASTNVPPENITVQRVMFRSRDDSEIFAVIAKPKAAGKHPGMLVLHGGGQCADVDKAMAWAQRGYVVVAPDLPGIADPKKLTEAKGRWSTLKYGEGRWVATPDGSASVIFDAVLSAMKSLDVLRAQPEVDTGRIGVVGVSWGGYMTTMVTGLAGDRVRAAFAVFGCGFYDLAVFQQVAMNKMPADEHERWLRDLDAGRRAPGIKAAFFLAGAANDYFYWPPAVQATLDAIPGEKNHLYAPNANHNVPLPGGTVFEKPKPFKPTPFQPYPTPQGGKANWLAMEVPFFDYYLKGQGQPLPRVLVEKTDDPHRARFRIMAPCALTKVEVYWARTNPDVVKREWIALTPAKVGEAYESQLPQEAADWFAVVSDDRPVTVSSDLVHVATPVATNERSLAGTWRFQLDTRNEGKVSRWFETMLADEIKLPGTTDEAHKGERNLNREIKHFTRVYPFNGAAWYQRDIDIPVSWNGKRITFELERTKTTTVWLDDREVGSQNSLTAPHVYDLGNVTPGRHVLTIRVSNQEKPPCGYSHQVSDQTQTDWNGIVGRIALKATEPVWLDAVQIAPDLGQKQARVRVVFAPGNVPVEGNIRVSAKSWNSATLHEPAPVMIPVKLGNDGVMEFTYDIGPGMQTWDEFSPALYQLTVDFTGQAGGKRVADRRVLNFGMREFKTQGTQFVVNGRPTFLRGKHDACVFPLTGYAPMNVEEWVRVLKISKSYGINTYRFHTWCPPDAAFAAADIVGIYMQPELPNWGPIGPPAKVDAKDVEVKNDSQPIEERTKYLTEEGHRILEQFGNHPSFVMLALGNENNGSREVMGKMVADFRAYDRGRRLFAQGSNNRLDHPTLAPGDDFWTTARTGGDYKDGVFQPNTKAKNIRGSTPNHAAGHINNDPPSTRHDYRVAIANIPMPVIGHEIGQFQVFPDFKEIPKFTGVVQARSFEVFRERLEQAGMLGQADDFVRASGALAVRCYREDIEAALRTPGFGGFHLLDLQDFPGQGTALVGILDSFMDSKGLITPETWREFCSETVPLLRFDRYTWTTDQTFEAEAQVANYGPQPFTNLAAQWTLADAAGKPLVRGTLPATDIPAGKVSSLGRVVIPLQNITAPQKLTLEFTLPGTQYRNHYPIWVYPAKLVPTAPSGVSVVRRFDEQTRAALAAGGRVVFLPETSALKQSLAGAFITDFWCYPMFKKYNPPGTMGILLDPKHPVFANFPTEYHSDWQWWRLTKNGRPMILDSLPRDLRPLVQVIDNFERNHRLGLLWEVQIGSGKLLVCSSDVLGQQNQPEVRQFYQGLLTYAASPAFQPKTSITFGELENILQCKSQ